MSLPSTQAATSYLDSSALVKRYLTEIGSSWVQALCDDPAQTIAVAEIGLVEIASAMARKLRGAHISLADYYDARAQLVADARNEYVLVVVNRVIVDEAIELTARHHLRGYDAVHLACALILNRALTANQLSPLTFVSADDDLLEGSGSRESPSRASPPPSINGNTARRAHIAPPSEVQRIVGTQHAVSLPHHHPYRVTSRGAVSCRDTACRACADPNMVS